MARCEVTLLEVDNSDKDALRRQMQRVAEIRKEGHTYVLDFGRTPQKTSFLVVSAKPYNETVIDTLVQARPGSRTAEMDFLRRAQFALLKKAVEEASQRFRGAAPSRSFELDLLPPGATPQKAQGKPAPSPPVGARVAMKPPVMKPPGETGGGGLFGDLSPPKPAKPAAAAPPSIAGPAETITGKAKERGPTQPAPHKAKHAARTGREGRLPPKPVSPKPGPKLASTALPSMHGPAEVGTGEVKERGPPSMPLPAIRRMPPGVTGKGTKESPFMITVDMKRGKHEIRSAMNVTPVAITPTETRNFYWKFLVRGFSVDLISLEEVTYDLSTRMYNALRASSVKVDEAALLRGIMRDLRKLGIWD